MAKKDKKFKTNEAFVVIGRQVHRLRIEAKMTQQVLADKCDLYRTYLSRLESGDANPTLKVLVALATALNVKVVELLRE